MACVKCLRHADGQQTLTSPSVLRGPGVLSGNPTYDY